MTIRLRGDIGVSDVSVARSHSEGVHFRYLAAGRFRLNSNQDAQTDSVRFEEDADLTRRR